MSEREAEGVFQEAADLPDGEREAFIVQRCAGDSDLLREVRSLLKFVDEPEDALLGRVRMPPAAARLPDRIGKYRIVRVIGEGGMGVVYEAIQEHPRRTVALKVLRWALASPYMIRRFEHEAEVLGQLSHPGIAQIYEAGSVETDFGRQPYFAMELVSGRTLAAYAAERGLGVRERLELIAMVCDAVHHAHQKGVIHRDLKPANIIITVRGEPKVLDFGIARAADSDNVALTRTEPGAMIGTLPYMSPEQVGGEPGVDTRSDVYALGVVMYELLAGRLPYELPSGIPEMARAIREDEPRPLTSVHHCFRGDVSTIVQKALQKEKERRYTSAAALADDIRRYLRDEPISARAPSTMYQLRKFTRRNRALVGGMAATAAALVLGVIAASAMAVRATRNEQRAIAAAHRALIAAAGADLKMQNGASARARLAEVALPERGWEWRYLNWLADQSIATLEAGERTAIAAGRIPSIGDRVVLQGGGTLRIWNPTTGRIEAEAATAIAEAAIFLSPDGTRILCIGDQGEARIAAYESSTLRELWRSSLPARKGANPFVPGALVVAVGIPEEHRVVLLDVETGATVRSIPLEEASPLRLGPIAAQRLVYEFRDRTEVLDLADGRRISNLPVAWGAPVRGGSKMVGIDGLDIVRIDVQTGQEEIRIPRIVQHRSVLAASDDGRWAAVAQSKGSIEMWDLASGHLVSTLHGHDGPVAQIAFPAGGEWLVSSDTGGVVRVWSRWASPEPFTAAATPDAAVSTSISPDGTMTATCGWGSVRVWDALTGTPRWTKVHWRNREGITPVISFTPAGRELLMVGWGGEAALFNGGDGSLVWRQPGVSTAPLDVFWESDGRAFVVAMKNGVLQRRESASGGSLLQVELGMALVAAAADPRGTRVALAGPGVLRLCSMDTLAVLAEWSTREIGLGDEAITRLCFSHDGERLAAAGSLGGLWVIDAASGRVRSSLRSGGGIHAMTFTRDDARIAAACDDGSVRIFDAERLTEVLVLDLPGGPASSIRARPDDALVLAGPRLGIASFEPFGSIERGRIRRLHADADAIVSRLIAEEHLSDAVIDRLSRLEGLGDDLRCAAIAAAKGRGDQLNYLNSSAWADCRFAGKPPEVYASALARAEAVCAQWPGERSFINTLGVARYRCGLFAEAVDALLESNRIGAALTGGHDAEDAAFLAMAYHHLGQRQEAERWLSAAVVAGGPDLPRQSERWVFIQEALRVVRGGS